MKIAIVTPEVVPFSKTGGLADVTGALPSRLAALGAEVITISPLHRSVRRHSLEAMPLLLRVPLGEQVLEAGVTRSGGSYFIGHDAFFDRDALYGTTQGDYPDNAARFIFFCRAALELLKKLGAPDVVHVHDWQAGLVPIYLKTLYAADFPRTRSVCTIHNLAYQGLFWHWDMPLTGLDWRHFNWKELEFHGKISFLKAALVHADVLTTVSPTYSREIQTKDLGCGLEGVLQDRAGALRGILNGVDYSEWSPENDPHIAARYSARSPAGKAKCRAALLARCGFPDEAGVPLVGMIGRLTEQKGIDLFVEAVPVLASLNVRFVILGSGDKRFQDAVVEAGRKHPDRFSVHVAFDDAFAHQIEAGSDLFLMPSRYEPCGLNQMYSLRYGAVPVVRATGGLADTVEDGVTGFVFGEYTAAAMVEALSRARTAWADPRTRNRIMAAGMKRDFGWEASARQYLDLYASLAAAK